MNKTYTRVSPKKREKGTGAVPPKITGTTTRADPVQMGQEELDHVAGDDPPPAGSEAEEHEFTLRQVLRLRLHGAPADQIAEYLKLSLAQVYQYTSQANKRLRGEVHDFDYPLFIGQTMAFYDEVRNMAMVEARKGTNPSGTKILALRTAVNTEGQKHSFLNRVGLFGLKSPDNTFRDKLKEEAADTTDGEDFAMFLQALAEETPPEVIEG